MEWTKGFKYQLQNLETYKSNILGHSVNSKFYALEPCGSIIAKAGFAWDGCTGSIDTDTNMRAGLFHDIGCLMVAKEEIPSNYMDPINDMFYDILSKDGMNPIRVWWHFRAVQAHFANGTKPDRRETYTNANRL